MYARGNGVPRCFLALVCTYLFSNSLLESREECVRVNKTQKVVQFCCISNVFKYCAMDMNICMFWYSSIIVNSTISILCHFSWFVNLSFILLISILTPLFSGICLNISHSEYQNSWPCTEKHCAKVKIVHELNNWTATKPKNWLGLWICSLPFISLALWSIFINFRIYLSLH